MRVLKLFTKRFNLSQKFRIENYKNIFSVKNVLFN